jgi:hypothetical protein
VSQLREVDAESVAGVPREVEDLAAGIERAKSQRSKASAAVDDDSGVELSRRFLELSREAVRLAGLAAASVDVQCRSAVATLLSKIAPLEQRVESLVQRNRQAGEPEDEATDLISKASESVSLARHLQQMVDKSPDLMEVGCVISCRVVHVVSCTSYRACAGGVCERAPKQLRHHRTVVLCCSWPRS